MSETTTVIASVFGTGIAIVGIIIGLARMLSNSMKGQFDGLKADMNRQFSDVNTRLQHVETRIDDTNKRIDTIGHDIAEIRDRTGALEGTLSTFMNAGRSPNAA